MQRVVIGVCGGSGSGKSTLVHELVSASSQRLCKLAFDSYYHDQRHLTDEERRRVNYDHPNSLDVDRFAADLADLKAGHSLATPVYDFTTHTRSADVDLLEPAPIILVDGILLFVFDQICDLIDIKVFVDASDEVRTERRLARDMAERGRSREFALAQIERTVRPMYGEFVLPSMDRADLVIDGTRDPRLSAKTVLARAQAVLTNA